MSNLKYCQLWYLAFVLPYHILAHSSDTARCCPLQLRTAVKCCWTPQSVFLSFLPFFYSAQVIKGKWTTAEKYLNKPAVKIPLSACVTHFRWGPLFPCLQGIPRPLRVLISLCLCRTTVCHKLKGEPAALDPSVKLLSAVNTKDSLYS